MSAGSTGFIPAHRPDHSSVGAGLQVDCGPCRRRGDGASAGVDVGLAAFFYTLTYLGVTVGFHRYFTHGAFKADLGLRITLAAVGSMAMQGPVTGWVADHRRHHAYADNEGDPIRRGATGDFRG